MAVTTKTGENSDARVSAAAAAMGRRGGMAQVPKGLSMLDDQRRSEIAAKGAEARWGKKRKKLKRK